MTPDIFQKSRYRAELDTFLNSPCGLEFLNALDHFAPQPKIVMPAGTVLRPGLITELSSIKLSELSGFKSCQIAIKALASPPASPKAPTQQPTYAEPTDKKGVK